MLHNNTCRRCGMGRLPSNAPLANPYVPMQTQDPPKYEPQKALIRGTLYQGLDLPFHGMVNNQEKPVTPLSQLQTLAFTIQELALYLDTHRDDQDALERYRNFQKMYETAKCQYEKECGTLTHLTPTDGPYRWLDDPWPWEYAKNRRG